MLVYVVLLSACDAEQALHVRLGTEATVADGDVVKVVEVGRDEPVIESVHVEGDDTSSRDRVDIRRAVHRDAIEVGQRSQQLRREDVLLG